MNRKKILSLILALMMLLTLIPAGAVADDGLFVEESSEENWDDQSLYEEPPFYENENFTKDELIEEHPENDDAISENESVFEQEAASEQEGIFNEGESGFDEQLPDSEENAAESEEGETISEFEMSNSDTFDAPGSIVISKQPESQTAAENATVSFTVEATGNGLTYLWYYRDKGATDWTSTGAVGRTATLNLKLTAARNGRQMRCLLRDTEGGRLFTNTVTATIATAGGIEITEQPKDVTAAENATVTFSVKASGENLTYLWYYSDDNGTTWKKTTGTTADYSWRLTAARDGRQLKCLVKDGSGNEKYSDVAKATIGAAGGIEITEQPKDVTAAENATVTFSVKATGNGLSYVWYYSDDNGTTWKKTTGIAADYSWKLTAARNGRQLKCLIKDASGAEAWSEVATATIEAASIVIDGVTYEPLTADTCKVVSYSGTATQLVIPETVEGMTVVEIGEEAFMGNTDLVSIDLPDTITAIRARAFKGCTSLAEMK